MKKILFIAFLSTTINIPLQADPPVQQAPATSALFGTQIIQCPEKLDGWHHEPVNLHDCGIIGMNVKPMCQKWNNGQISAPADWQYHDAKRYSGLDYIVSTHYMGEVNNKDYLYCGYSMNRSEPYWTNYIIKQREPSGKACTKIANFSFKCKRPALEHIRPLGR